MAMLGIRQVSELTTKLVKVKEKKSNSVDVEERKYLRPEIK